MNFLGMGPMELMVILVLALIVFGPGKLPEIAGQVGRVVRDFRRMTGELSSEFNRTLSLEIEERRATGAPAPPAAPYESYDTSAAPAADYAAPATEPAEAPPTAAASTSTAVQDTPVVSAPEPAPQPTTASRRRVIDTEIVPPY
jgi:sec-independent protein translocase protein TatB